MTDQPTHRLRLGGDRARPAPLKAHQGWILPAGAEGFCGFDAPLDYVTVSIAPELLHAAGAPDPTSLRPILGEIDPVILALALQAERFEAGGALYRDSMHQALAAQIVQVTGLKTRAERLDDRRLGRAVAYIRDNLAGDVRIQALAEEAAMSPAHFSRAFRARMGTSPLQFVIAQRLALATALLRESALSVAQIAHRVGYTDVARFGQHFRRQYGATPAAFRKR
ncbi:MAG: AraC family transcriptional regulator [Pseudomonadota bacterium]